METSLQLINQSITNINSTTLFNIIKMYKETKYSIDQIQVKKTRAISCFIIKKKSKPYLFKILLLTIKPKIPSNIIWK